MPYEKKRQENANVCYVITATPGRQHPAIQKLIAKNNNGQPYPTYTNLAQAIEALCSLKRDNQDFVDTNVINHGPTIYKIKACPPGAEPIMKALPDGTNTMPLTERELQIINAALRAAELPIDNSPPPTRGRC